jgi:hypothetical protein
LVIAVLQQLDDHFELSVDAHQLEPDSANERNELGELSGRFSATPHDPNRGDHRATSAR